MRLRGEGFLCDTLMEKIGGRTPGFQGCFHRRRGYGLIKEAQRRLIGLEFSCHEAALYQL